MHTAGVLSDNRPCRDLIRRSENPYATLYYETEHDDDNAPSVANLHPMAIHEKAPQKQQDSQVSSINQQTI